MSDWRQVCVLCAARGRERRLESGHCCASCQTGLTDALRAILRLCEMASAAIVPASSGDTGRGGYESRPAANLAAVDPELTLMPLFDGDNVGTTVLDMCEGWERAIRFDRGWLPYGPASAMRSGAGTATLTGVIGFLEGQVPWITTTPDFGLEDFSWQMHRAAGILAHWDPEHERAGTMVRCPTLADDGECGYRLHYDQPDEKVTCRRCGVTRDAMTLVTVALADGDAEVWVDGEAAQKETGVPVATLRRWTRRGILRVSHGRYDLRAIHRAVEGERIAAHLNLLRRVAGDT